MKVEEQREWLDQWYGFMKNQQQDHADTEKEEIEARLDELTDPEMEKLYELLKVRYHLMYEDLEKAAAALAETGLEQDKHHWLNYYYHFFRGIYHYERKEYRTAIDHYNKARLFISDIPIEETAELYYKLAAAYNRTYQISKSIKYTERALEIFKSKSHYKRIADCENLLGLNNHDIEQYREAEQRYQDALIYVEKANDGLLKLKILHNLGYLYTAKNDAKAALDYLNQVYQLLESEKDYFRDKYLKIQNLYLLAKNFFKTDQVEIASRMVHVGIDHSKETGNQNYRYHFNILLAKFLEPARLERAYKEAISYFNSLEKWELVEEYGEELAFYLRGTGNHQDAAEYFHMASEARNQMKKERLVYND